MNSWMYPSTINVALIVTISVIALVVAIVVAVIVARRGGYSVLTAIFSAVILAFAVFIVTFAVNTFTTYHEIGESLQAWAAEEYDIELTPSLADSLMGGEQVVIEYEGKNIAVSLAEVADGGSVFVSDESNTPLPQSD